MSLLKLNIMIQAIFINYCAYKVYVVFNMTIFFDQFDISYFIRKSSQIYVQIMQ